MSTDWRCMPNNDKDEEGEEDELPPPVEFAHSALTAVSSDDDAAAAASASAAAVLDDCEASPPAFDSVVVKGGWAEDDSEQDIPSEKNTSLLLLDPDETKFDDVGGDNSDSNSSADDDEHEAVDDKNVGDDKDVDDFGYVTPNSRYGTTTDDDDEDDYEIGYVTPDSRGCYESTTDEEEQGDNNNITNVRHRLGRAKEEICNHNDDHNMTQAIEDGIEVARDQSSIDDNHDHHRVNKAVAPSPLSEGYWSSHEIESDTPGRSRRVETPNPELFQWHQMNEALATLREIVNSQQEKQVETTSAASVPSRQDTSFLSQLNHDLGLVAEEPMKGKPRQQQQFEEEEQQPEQRQRSPNTMERFLRLAILALIIVALVLLITRYCTGRKRAIG